MLYLHYTEKLYDLKMYKKFIVSFKYLIFKTTNR